MRALIFIWLNSKLNSASFGGTFVKFRGYYFEISKNAVLRRRKIFRIFFSHHCVGHLNPTQCAKFQVRRPIFQKSSGHPSYSPVGNFFSVLYITWLSKITRPKNKKLLNKLSFLFYIHVVREKSTAYSKYIKKTQKSPENLFYRRRVK